MPFDGAGAGSDAKVIRPETPCSFYHILPDRIGKGVRGCKPKLLLRANPNDPAPDAAPSSGCPDLFAGAGLLTLEDRSILHGA